jgi:NAD-dependent oxidoreductase involved in siderophore biosynthesis
VRSAALEAGAWCGVPQVLTSVRELAATAPLENSHVLPLLAIIGTDGDLTLIESLGCTEALGPMRYTLLATSGNTRFVEQILTGMESVDPKTAVAAGAAFTKLTGLNIDSQNVAAVPPDGEAADDAFAQEFADQLTLPDAAAARQKWQLLAERGAVHHMAAGRNLDTLDAATFNAIDMQSRYEICLRSRFHGLWTGTPVELERFPQHL